jgi:GNAT superfamily N-acetyltransferase
VLFAEDLGGEDAARRVERIDRRVDPDLGELAAEHRRRVEVRERRRGRGVGEVVGRHVDRLHRRDRSLRRRGDALLEHAHLGAERRLVADRARDSAEERRHFGAACVNRKMLSMKSSTSWPSSSRKNSATVRADSATRARAPGGSFIWP